MGLARTTVNTTLFYVMDGVSFPVGEGSATGDGAPSSSLPWRVLEEPH